MITDQSKGGHRDKTKIKTKAKQTHPMEMNAKQNCAQGGFVITWFLFSKYIQIRHYFNYCGTEQEEPVTDDEQIIAVNVLERS